MGRKNEEGFWALLLVLANGIPQGFEAADLENRAGGMFNSFMNFGSCMACCDLGIAQRPRFPLACACESISN